MFKGFSSDDFWNQNPCPETPSGDVYSIGTDPYGYNSDSDRWERLDDD